MSARTPVVHELKAVDPHFDEVAEGRKTFEYRRDDRAYAVGDILHLRQYDALTDSYSGFEVRVRVTHLLRGPTWDVGNGYVIMSVARESDEAEATRLRAVLQSIANRQPEAPWEAKERGVADSSYFEALGRWECAEEAREALVKP